MNIWESVFSQSRVNDGHYDEESLPQVHWDWPKRTWFQARLDYAREHEPVWSLKAGKRSREADELPTM